MGLVKIESPFDYPFGATYRDEDDDAHHPSLILGCSFNIETVRFDYILSDGRHCTMLCPGEPLPEEGLYELAFLPLRAHLDAYKERGEFKP